MFLFYVPYGLASNIRVKSIGQTALITEDEDNQINLFDFGSNPAWLLQDEERKWLKVYGKGNIYWGNFHRLYDPDEIVNVHTIFEGIKLLSKNQIFRGMVDYKGTFKQGVYYAINREPYLNHPYRLTDGTKGDMHYNGPKVMAQYCRAIYQGKLFIAGTVAYQLENGLKKNFPQPRSIYYSAAIGAALAYRLSKKISVGTTFDYINSQEFIECIKQSMIDTLGFKMMLYRGESIYICRFNDMNMFTKIKTFKWGAQTIFNVNEDLNIGLRITGNLQDLKVAENLIMPIKDGIWKLSGYEFNLKVRDRIATTPWQLGFSFDKIYHNDWAKHPEYDVLFGDDFFSRISWGFGFAYKPIKGRLYIACEIHHAVSSIDKQDYVSRLIASGNIIENEIRAGLEYFLFKHYFLRTGCILANNQPEDNLLKFSEFELKHKKYTFTAGLGLKFKFLEADFCFQYSKKLNCEQTISLKNRKLVNLIAMLKFYKF